MALAYPNEVMKHFLKPKNMGEIKNPDGYGKVGNPSCGDVMEIFIKVKNNKISQIKFKTLGCAVAIALSSILTQVAKGKTIEEAEKIQNKDLLKLLKGDIPPSKFHCSVLAEQALKAAIEDYKKRQLQKN